MFESQATRIARFDAVRWLPFLVTILLTAAVIVFAVGWSWLAIGMAAIAFVTWPLVQMDFSEHRLPNRLVLPCYPVVIASIALHSVTTGESAVLAILAGLGALAFFAVMHLLGGMGMGDVKLVGLLAALLGALGATPLVAGMSSAFLFGAVAGGWAMASRRRALTHRIPFGPFLLLGFWLGVLAAAFRPA